MSDDAIIVVVAGLMATACGLLGPFLLLRRMALLSDAVSHAVLPGIVAVWLVAQTRAPLPVIAGAAAFAVICVLVHRRPARHRAGRLGRRDRAGLPRAVLPRRPRHHAVRLGHPPRPGRHDLRRARARPVHHRAARRRRGGPRGPGARRGRASPTCCCSCCCGRSWRPRRSTRSSPPALRLRPAAADPAAGAGRGGDGGVGVRGGRRDPRGDDADRAGRHRLPADPAAGDDGGGGGRRRLGRRRRRAAAGVRHWTARSPGRWGWSAPGASWRRAGPSGAAVPRSGAAGQPTCGSEAEGLRGAGVG